MTIENGFTVTLKNLKLINANSTAYGGAIANNGNLTVFNSNFINNRASLGAAICNLANLTVIKSTFTNNYATTSGGAIVNGADINIADSTFTNNSASYGGAIYAVSYIIITNSKFTNNHATNGGAILTEGATLIISKSTFTNNYATTSGGTIFNVGNLTISQSILSSTADTIFHYSDEFGVCIADGNYWGNKNPTTYNLTNVAVNNYYKFFLTKSTNKNIYTGDKLTLNLVLGLNTTKAKDWTGPTVSNAPYTTFTSKPTTSITKISNTKATLTAKTKGIYTVTATNSEGKDTIQVTVINKPVTVLKITHTTPRNGQKGYSQTRTIIITFNQKIKKSSKYTKIYMKNLNTKKRVSITTKIIGNKLYIKMVFKRYKRHYYRIYIPRYAIINSKKKTITKARTIKFRT